MTIRTRITTLVCTAIAGITLSSSTAIAQPFIEIHVTGTIRQGSDLCVPYGLRAIFDAGADADAGGGPGSFFIQFNAVWGEAVQTAGATPITSCLEPPFTTSPGPLEYLPADIEFRFYDIFDHYRISTFFNGEDSEFIVPNSEMSLLMDTLPDDLRDYQQDNSAIESMKFEADAGSAIWDEIGFSEGTMTVNIGFVDDPTEPECLADFNGDGVYDIFDVLAFVEEYNAGCPD
jgi:hypothetical protein